MARTRFNPKRVKINFSYRIEQIARLLGVHKNTVRAWLKAGLETIDDGRPAMVQGRVLRAFLERKRTSNRYVCPPGTLPCMKCRAARRPALGMVDFVPFTPSSGNLRALCEECGTLIHRTANRAQVSALMPNLEVRMVEADPRLTGSRAPSLNRDSGRER